MSLEKAIEENTAAVTALTASIEKMLAMTPNTAPPAGLEVVPAEITKPQAENENPAQKKETDKEKPVLTLKDLQPPFVKLANKDRQAATDLLQRYGVDPAQGGRLPDLKPEFFAEVLDAVNKLLEA